MEMDGLPFPRRRWAALAIGLVVTLAVLDGVIANVALPTLVRELDITPAASIWVVNAYQIAVVAALLPLASLGEILGYRRIYQAGVAVFTLASLACALAPDLPLLILARVLQGLGAAGIMSMNLTMVRFTYPRSVLGRALGMNSVIIAITTVIGPTIASAILEVAPWPWLFAVNVPLGLAALIVGMVTLPAPQGSGRRFDWVAAILNTLTFGPLIVGVEGVVEGGRWGLTALELEVGVCAGAALIRRSLSTPRPLVPIDLLRNRLFTLAVATSTAAFTAQTFAFVLLPFLIQNAYGRSVVETGLLLTPWSIMVGIVAPISGRLTDRQPGAILSSAGLLLMALGLLLLALLPPDPSTLDIVWRMAVAGAGFGLFQQPNNRAMLTSSPPDRAGSAGGMLATARLLGQTAGATLVALLFRITGGAPSSGILLIAVGFSLLGCLLSWMKPDRGRRPG